MIIGRAIQAERTLSSPQTFRIVGLMTVFIVAVTGAAQATVNSDEFPSMWDGIWWAITTVTTVGYGDLYPTTIQGRIIGIVLMLVGIGFLSVLTATIASRFIKDERSSETDEILAALTRIEAELGELKAGRTF